MTSQPLLGRRIVITRMSQQGGRLRRLLTELGAIDVSVPLIALSPPSDGGESLRAAMAELNSYDWLVVTSPNGADAVAQALASGLLASGLSGLPAVAAIGPGTADRLSRNGIEVSFVPDRSVGEGLVEEFPAATTDADSVLVVQAEAARPVVVDGLSAKGWKVDWAAGYRTVDATVTDEQRAQIAAADMITFTSSSTVDRFCDLVGLDHLPGSAVSIGPITSATARAAGIDIAIEAQAHTIDGIVSAIVDHATATDNPPS